MKHQFKNVETFTIYHNFEKKSCLAYYEPQNIDSIHNFINLAKDNNCQSVEITVDIEDKYTKTFVEGNNFIPAYDWFEFRLSQYTHNPVSANIEDNPNRDAIHHLLIDQMKELAQRDPSLFDENGEDENWTSYGGISITYKIEDQIVSVLTYDYEPTTPKTIHIYLMYTIPEYRGQQFGSQLISHVKNIALRNNIQKITVCTDTSSQNRVPKLFKENGFTHYQRSYVSLL